MPDAPVSRSSSALYTIPAGVPFADALAQGLLSRSDGDPAALAAMRIMLPTRRACRTMREAFLRLSHGKPLLLPRLQPLGDIDEDELTLALDDEALSGALLTLPPAMPPLRRQILLARAIAALPAYTRGPAQDFALAGALGRFMDQIYTEGLDLKALPALVQDETLAAHWQVTVEFLTILSARWPEILAENGAIDAADRRGRLLALLADHWQAAPPQTPVIAAGSTGSIPATGRLLKVIAGLPQGMVILPGLDTVMDEESWQALDDTHPQATLGHLLEAHLGVTRTDIRDWPHEPPATIQADEPPALQARTQAARRTLATEMMRPAATTAQWRRLSPDETDADALKGTLGRLARFEADTPQQEALMIALLMRQTLETPDRTAALVTPDRALARRVVTTCRRWGLTVDDSAGTALTETAPGSYLRLCAAVLSGGFQAGALAALLKHELCRFGYSRTEKAARIAVLETVALRGPPPRDFAALRTRLPGNETVQDFAAALEQHFAPLANLMQDGAAPFAALLDAHITLAETLAAGPAGDHNLWQGDDGEAAALFLADLRAQAALMPALDDASYLSLLEQLMRTITVRPSYGTHPRLLILGQLEARLMQADLVILGGLNEGTWPPDPASEPWLSRPMRARFGLPAPERQIGLAAHDFIQGFCAPHVVLTRARRAGNAPSVPARWWQRLDTVLQALTIDPAGLSPGLPRSWLTALDQPSGPPQPAARPAPRPPVSARPDALYVTAIERWMRDPYSLYARYILGLRKLPDLEEQTDAALRGTLMHEALDAFVRAHPDTLPDSAAALLLDQGRTLLADQADADRLWGFWWPRFTRLAAWFVDHERQWRLMAAPLATEAEGRLALDIDGSPFTLSAKADRIDRLRAGGYALVDYKTGGTPSGREIEAGFAPQLPLEALILEAGGFADIPPGPAAYTGFWKMSGGVPPGEEKTVSAASAAARAGLEGLVRAFRDPQTPYYSLPRPDAAPPAAWQDYAHLARVPEWTALDDPAEAA